MMVQQTKTGHTTRYQCKACGFFFADREWAEKCEAWCMKHKSCNLDIVKHALKTSG